MVEDPDTVAEKFMLETMLEMLDHLPEHSQSTGKKVTLQKKNTIIYFMSMSG